MRLFHLSDLHIGKQLHGYSLKEDQETVLRQVADYARQLRPEAVILAGDIYDKSVPAAEAVEVLDDFLTELAGLTPPVPVLFVSGNHDSPQRLKFAGKILRRQQIYLSCDVPEEGIRQVTLYDEYGPVHFYLLPFIRPGYVRWQFEEGMAETYQDAVKAVLEREQIDENARNVLVSHQFYMAQSTLPKTCGSESFSVGGVDQVDAGLLSAFDYVALGHLHGAQKVGRESVRYCGTLLKYSVSEASQNKSLLMVELKEKGSAPVLTRFPITPLRDVRIVRGTLEEVLASGKADGKRAADYVSISLTDLQEPYRPVERLREVYPFLLEVRMENRKQAFLLEEDEEEELILSQPLVLFEEFYREIHGREITEEERALLKEVLEEVKEEE